MITLKEEDKICTCGHYRSHHSQSWERACYQSTRRKERRKNKVTNKYEIVVCSYCCPCKKFEEKNEQNN